MIPECLSPWLHRREPGPELHYGQDVLRQDHGAVAAFLAHGLQGPTGLHGPVQGGVSTGGDGGEAGREAGGKGLEGGIGGRRGGGGGEGGVASSHRAHGLCQ